jgi:ABC-type amino acid transport substrate-binding protein
MKRLLFFIFFVQFMRISAQDTTKVIQYSPDTIHFYYYENHPFAYSENGELKGIEVDIINYFKEWLNEEKGIQTNLKPRKYIYFDRFLLELYTAQENTIGAGSIAIEEERREKLDFTSPYLQNISVLISSGKAPTLLDMNKAKEIFGDMRPVTVKGSIHEEHLRKLGQRSANNDLIIYVENQDEIFKLIEENEDYYGYVDVIAYWKYLKNTDTYLRMHSLVNKAEEKFAFALPKNSKLKPLFDEFFDKGFGFTATKDYHKILEKYLGYEILNKVEIDY